MTTVTPAVATTNVPVVATTTLVTAVVTETRWPAISELAFVCPTLTLPTGRWLVTTHVSSLPGKTAGPPVSNTSDTTLASTGTITVPTLHFDVLRSFDGSDSTAHCAIEVQKRSGTDWVAYARGQSTVTVPTAPTKTPQTHYGSSVHLLLNPTTGVKQVGGNTPNLLAYLDALVDAGADMVRTAYGWYDLAPTSATFDATFAADVDAFMAACATRNLKVVAQLGVPAPWTGGLTATTPTNAQLDAFFDAVLARWHPYAIEFDNEPNQGFYYHPGTAVPAAWQVRCIQRMYLRAQAATPIPKVGGSSLAFGDAAYLQAMYTAGLAGYIDYVSLHSYDVRFDNLRIGDPSQPWEHDDSGATFVPGGTAPVGPMKWVQAVHAIYRTMVANGDGAKPVWLTEGGWSTSLLYPTAGLRCSEQQQADYTATAIKQMARCPMVETLLTYSTYDDGPPSLTAWSDWGLVRNDGSHKPVWTVWRDTVAAMVA